MVLGKADLHVHSSYSSDCTSSIEVVLDQAAFRAGLDVIAITDHDGALRALELADYGIGVIPGSEISINRATCWPCLFVSPFRGAYRSMSRSLESVSKVGCASPPIQWQLTLIL